MLLIFNHVAVHVKNTGEIGKIKISKIENKETKQAYKFDVG